MILRTPSRLVPAALLVLTAGGLAVPAAAAQPPARPSGPVLVDDIGELSHRIKVLQLAQHIYSDSGYEEAAKTFGRFLYVAKLQQKGASQAELLEAFQGLSMESIVKLLRGAEELYAERGQKERAFAVRELADYYSKREAARSPSVEAARAPAKIDYTDRAARIKVLELTLQAHADAGDKESVAAMKRVLKLARLQLKEAPAEEIAAAAEGLTQNTIIDLVRGAEARLREADRPKEAAACGGLVAYYENRDGAAAAQQEADRQRELAEAERRAAQHHEHDIRQRQREEARRAEAQAEAERRAAERQRERRNQGAFRGDLGELRQRVAILRAVRHAYAEAGQHERRGRMDRILHLAELQLEGADEEAVAQAAEGLSQDEIIRLVRGAAELYAEWGHEERAAACKALYGYYVQREQGRTDAPRARDDEPDSNDAERERQADRARRIEELMQQIRALEQQLDAVQRELESLMRK